MDYKNLFIKYLCHIGEAEGIDYVTSVNISPARMGPLEFSDDEKKTLENEIFVEARNLYNKENPSIG